MAKKRKEVLSGKTTRIKTACGSFFLTLNQQDGELAEVRMELGKSGNCQKGLLHLIAVLISYTLQATDDPKEIKKFVQKHLVGVICGNPFFCDKDKKDYRSCIDWAGQSILEEFVSPNGKK